jgi:hypothetical protein
VLSVIFLYICACVCVYVCVCVCCFFGAGGLAGGHLFGTQCSVDCSPNTIQSIKHPPSRPPALPHQVTTTTTNNPTTPHNTTRRQWFPETARCMAVQGAELLFFPTAIGSEPQDGALDSRHHWYGVVCVYVCVCVCV